MDDVTSLPGAVARYLHHPGVEEMFAADELPEPQRGAGGPSVDLGKLVALAAYRNTNHAQTVIDLIGKLDELHGARDQEEDFRCRTCRTSSGKPEPWPCRTYVEFGALLGVTRTLDADTVAMFRAAGAYRNGRRGAVAALEAAAARVQARRRSSGEAR